MGTNFYIHTKKDKIHIGKRSAAGLYCWDCKITLCEGGNSKIHSGHSNWHSLCPKCGKSNEEDFINSSAARELGFNKTEFKSKSGVMTCSSFTWAMEPEEFYNLPRYVTIYNEYGEKFTKGRFKKMMKECPIQFKLLGQEFS